MARAWAMQYVPLIRNWVDHLLAGGQHTCWMWVPQEAHWQAVEAATGMPEAPHS
jgi:hypothetical protein